MADLGTRTESTADRAVPRTRTWTIAATASLGWALFTLTVLHLVSSFDPLVDPISRYAFTDRGSGMLEASLLSFAIGVLAVRGALLASGLATSRMTSVLAIATAGGLCAAALFPATFTSDIAPESGLIHQYASVLAFVGLPAIAFSMLDGLRGVPALAAERAMLVRLLITGLIAVVLFGVSYVADSVPETPLMSTIATALPVGLTQRIVFVADFGLLTSLLVVATRASRMRMPGPRE